MRRSLLSVFLTVFLSAQATDLFISEYSEGSSYNKYIEIFNGTGDSVDLSNYKLWKITNGGSWPERELSLTGTLENNSVYIISHSNANSSVLNLSNVTWGSANWNGNDAVGLSKNIGESWTLIDAVGTDGDDPGSGWNVAGVTNATANHTLVRKSSISQGNINWSSSAGTDSDNSEWIVYDQDTFDYLGSHSFTGSTSGIVINEIHYNPDGSDDLYEFLELYNSENRSIDISGFSFTRGISFTLPSTTVITANQYIVLAKTSSTYSGENYPVFQYSGDLGNSGETVEFSTTTSGGLVVDAVTYSNTSPWPVGADGNGPSLELIHPSLDNSTSGNWRASFVDGGTPGMSNSTNSGPIALSDYYIVNEDDTLTVGVPGVLTNDSDPNQQSLTVFLNTDVIHGKLNLNSDGSFTYLPETDYFGGDSFSYFAHDGIGDSPVVSVTIDVYSVNDAPGFSPISDPDSIPEDSGEQGIELKEIHSGAPNEADELTISAVSNNTNLVSHPTVIYTTPDSVGAVIYSPLPDAFGETTLSVKVKDSGGTDHGGVDSTTVKFSIVVIAVDDPPDVNLGEIIFPEDSSITVPLPVTDIDGDTLTYSDVKSDTAAITVTLIEDSLGARFVLTPAENWHGRANIEFTVSDGLTETIETCLLTVEPENDTPGPFNLIWPENNMVIQITPEMLDEPFLFTWEESDDIDGDTIVYDLSVTETLSFLTSEGIDTNFWMLNYSDVIEQMGGIDTARGTWTVIASDGELIVGAINGPFVLTLDATTVAVDESKSIPKFFTLHQNYPNPFNPKTIILYEIPERSDIQVGIYDILGQRVCTVVTGNRGSGYYRAEWNGRDDRGIPVPSGVYIYRITASNPSTGILTYTAARKLIFLK